MKANELRIGNYVDFYDEYISKVIPCKNKKIDKYDLIELFTDTAFYTPIPLTEEKLIKAGAEHNIFSGRDKYSIEITECLTFVYSDNSYYLFDEINSEELVSFGDEYFLHQLQNLYFTLKGEELELKL